MSALIDWFRANARVLPWRGDEPRDPYRVWISEIMLQQTRVDTVLRYYERFLLSFPDVAALADAPEDTLMKVWEGLGYYRRARLLQQGARHVVAHGMPTSYLEWREVPGVGPYTAGAIASLAHGEPVAAVDGNVLRVFARMRRYEAPVDTPAARRAAEAWVHAERAREEPGAFNEALMELGATVCTPNAPRCGECPLVSSCKGRDIAARLPLKRPRTPPTHMRVALALVRRADTLLLEKRDSGLLAGTWGLPWVEGGRDALEQHVASLTGAPARAEVRPVADGHHVFTHRHWEMTVYAVETEGKGGEWRAPASVALGTAHRKMLAAVRDKAAWPAALRTS